ncbi:MAG: NAD(P)/FAD-dependent oxidoreductase [Chitinophagaceae bacterium]
MLKIGIIGGGLSGLVTAKTMLEYGYEIIVFEKNNEAGGVWAGKNHYPGLCIQNTRDSYAFSDFPMPKHYPEFPSGGQMLDYLKSYIRRFSLDEHIRTEHHVKEIQLLHQNGKTRWAVKGAKGDDSFYEEVDFLIICNGTFSEPFIPHKEGMEIFSAEGGSILHTSQVNNEVAYKDKEVVVIGFGKSACDVAAAIAPEAKKVSIIYNEAKWKVPKKILGINYKYIVLSRFGESLTKLRYRNRIESTIHFLKIPSAAIGFLQRVFVKQQGLSKINLKPSLGIKDYLFGELSVESDNFYKQVQQHKIVPVKAAIKSFAKGGIYLSDESFVKADTVIFGTGFSQELPFIPAAIRKMFTDEKGNYQLYRNILPVGVPALAFNGYNSSFFCNLTSEIGALWLAEYTSGHIKTPSIEEMNSQIQEHQEWRKQFRMNAFFKGASVYPFNITYVDWLLKDMNARLPFGKLLSEWLVVVNPANYAGVKKKIMKRSFEAR